MARLPALPVVARRGTSPNEPEPGWWLVRWRRNSAEVPAAIWRIEHEPGNPNNLLSTGPIFVAAIAGEEVDPLTVWAGLRKRPISESEYRYRVADQAWLRCARPDDPKSNPRQPIDLTTMKAPF
jgi:hypothetical protein